MSWLRGGLGVARRPTPSPSPIRVRGGQEPDEPLHPQMLLDPSHARRDGLALGWRSSANSTRTCVHEEQYVIYDRFARGPDHPTTEEEEPDRLKILGSGKYDLVIKRLSREKWMGFTETEINDLGPEKIQDIIMQTLFGGIPFPPKRGESLKFRFVKDTDRGYYSASVSHVWDGRPKNFREFLTTKLLPDQILPPGRRMNEWIVFREIDEIQIRDGRDISHALPWKIDAFMPTNGDDDKERQTIFEGLHILNQLFPKEREITKTLWAAVPRYGSAEWLRISGSWKQRAFYSGNSDDALRCRQSFYRDFLWKIDDSCVNVYPAGWNPGDVTYEQWTEALGAHYSMRANAAGVVSHGLGNSSARLPKASANDQATTTKAAQSTLNATNDQATSNSRKSGPSIEKASKQVEDSSTSTEEICSTKHCYTRLDLLSSDDRHFHQRMHSPPVFCSVDNCFTALNMLNDGQRKQHVQMHGGTGSDSPASSTEQRPGRGRICPHHEACKCDLDKLSIEQQEQHSLMHTSYRCPRIKCHAPLGSMTFRRTELHHAMHGNPSGNPATLKRRHDQMEKGEEESGEKDKQTEKEKEVGPASKRIKHTMPISTTAESNELVREAIRTLEMEKAREAVAAWQDFRLLHQTVLQTRRDDPDFAQKQSAARTAMGTMNIRLGELALLLGMSGLGEVQVSEEQMGDRGAEPNETTNRNRSPSWEEPEQDHIDEGNSDNVDSDGAEVSRLDLDPDPVGDDGYKPPKEPPVGKNNGFGNTRSYVRDENGKLVELVSGDRLAPQGYIITRGKICVMHRRCRANVQAMDPSEISEHIKMHSPTLQRCKVDPRCKAVLNFMNEKQVRRHAWMHKLAHDPGRRPPRGLKEPKNLEDLDKADRSSKCPFHTLCHSDWNKMSSKRPKKTEPSPQEDHELMHTEDRCHVSFCHAPMWFWEDGVRALHEEMHEDPNQDDSEDEGYEPGKHREKKHRVEFHYGREWDTWEPMDDELQGQEMRDWLNHNGYTFDDDDATTDLGVTEADSSRVRNVNIKKTTFHVNDTEADPADGEEFTTSYCDVALKTPDTLLTSSPRSAATAVPSPGSDTPSRVVTKPGAVKVDPVPVPASPSEPQEAVKEKKRKARTIVPGSSGEPPSKKARKFKSDRPAKKVTQKAKVPAPKVLPRVTRRTATK